MAIISGHSREDRIKKEYNRLKRLLKELPKEKLSAADGVIKRVAFMAITLEDLEDDINDNGTVEEFTQGENTYDRQRPAATIYNATIKNYTNACKQLTDLIPAEKKKTDGNDPFQKIMGRGG
ncbi:P27 family phage terminase small subunit [Paenibacillus sp. ACRRX]|uniref:P27 family phage terminase small subunit n=1 Tax=Paenibacillus sp. ACRRX TaxID=2918206 RepID=UPI001EF56699|nr:P27 family phage terminase small subunit [Paenibacillus sp. ACRRX]MCG7410586.1 P27 family phage terminase small subunit [Paenibacillus sp. ACRRX]